METLNAQLLPFSEWLLKTTVQGSVLIALILLVKIVVRDKLPVRWHYYLWLILFVRIVLPWAPRSKLSLFNLIPASLHAQPILPIGKRAGFFAFVDALPHIWLLGAFILAGYIVLRSLRLWTMVRRERPVTDQQILDLLEDCKMEMHIQTIVGVVVSDRVKSPALFGYIRPRLLLPQGILETHEPDELRYIFIHELAHLKQRDIYLSWLMTLLQVVYWFNPLMWFAVRRIRLEREFSCDGLALSALSADEPPRYGHTIVNLLEKFSHVNYVPSVAGIIEDTSQIERRIKMIAQFKKTSRLRSAWAILLLALLACIALTDPYPAGADFTFGTPTNLGPTVNSSAGDSGASISADGLELFFTSRRPGGYGYGDIYVTTRETIDANWGTPANLGPTVNSSATDGFPSISADGLSLYFHSWRTGGYGKADIWVTTRPTGSAPWGLPVNLGPPVNSSYYEGFPSISADGLSLYFSEWDSPYRPGGYGSSDIWVTTRASTSDPWGAPVNLGGTVNSSSWDARPNISADGLSLLFDSDRAGGQGSLDLWVATRQTTDAEWSAPVNLGPVVNSSYGEESPSISADGCTLYFDSNRSGGVGDLDLWQASVFPVVDFKPDGKVDFKDYSKLAQYWLQDESSVDIAPTPLGDRMVDANDLAVLGEYWLADFRLMAHWKLDETEGSIAHDSASDHDGTIHGYPRWQPTDGKIDGALQFYGIDDYVNCGFVLNPVDGPFSAFAWIKGGGPGQAILSQVVGPTFAPIWLGADESEGKLMTSLMFPLPPLQSETVIIDGYWHHAGLVWDGSHRHLYVDGAEAAEDVTPISALSCDGDVHIGAGRSTDPNGFWSGLIDDVRVYDQALSSDEIAVLAD